jgi:uncharacterized protein YciU (UPF0263 family)
MSHDIFISYASENRDPADVLVRTLENNGYKCWIAPRDMSPGVNWGEALIRAIEAAGLFVVLISKKSADSDFVLRDVFLADKKMIPILPVRLERVSHPSDNFGVFHPSDKLDLLLGDSHQIDATNGEGEQRFAGLVAHLKRRYPKIGNPTAVAPETPEAPQTKGYVFVSYNKSDANFVEKLKEVLKRRNYAYWDYSESERDYHSALYKELELKIEGARAFMSIVTDSWRDTEWPGAEYMYAKDAGIPIFVIQAKPLARPVPIILNQQTRIDMSADFERGAAILEHELEKKKL